MYVHIIFVNYVPNTYTTQNLHKFEFASLKKAKSRSLYSPMLSQDFFYQIIINTLKGALVVVQTRLNIILCYKMWNNLHQMSIKVILVTVTCLNREQNWSPEIIIYKYNMYGTFNNKWWYLHYISVICSTSKFDSEHC